MLFTIVSFALSVRQEAFHPVPGAFPRAVMACEKRLMSQSRAVSPEEDRLAQTDRPDSGTASDEELSALANNLVDLWKRILRTDDITLDDDFFELGGNSLSAIRLLPAIEEQFGVEPTISLVFDHPTPHQMAEALATIGAAADQRQQDAR
jgi:acyl carrier protein